jgi:hypothetical protein
LLEVGKAGDPGRDSRRPLRRLCRAHPGAAIHMTVTADEVVYRAV